MDVLDIDRVMLGRPDAQETIDRFEELLGLSFTDVVDSVTGDGRDGQPVTHRRLRQGRHRA